MTLMSNTPFERFFHGQFDTMLNAVGDVPGLMTADFPLSQSSWDRKAAFLLWTSLGSPGAEPPAATDDLDDILG